MKSNNQNFDDIATALHKALANQSIYQSIKFFLDWSPELKHEGLVCTHLSAYLQSIGRQSRREVDIQIDDVRRRVDLQIDNANIEAKYHFEGDMLSIKNAIERNANNEILSELNRGKDSYFLWHICVRSENSNKIYKLPQLIKRFYGHSNIKTLLDATTSAKKFIDEELFPLFEEVKPQIKLHKMPTIYGDHSSLITRLYYFETTNT